MKVYIKTYGIACVEEKDGQMEIIAAVNNVTVDREQVDRIIALFNKHHLSPEHMEDVIQDILAIS